MHTAAVLPNPVDEPGPALDRAPDPDDEHLFDDWVPAPLSERDAPPMRAPTAAPGSPSTASPAGIPLAPPPATAVLDADAERDLKRAGDRLGDAFPKGGWLAEYLRAMTPLTGSPVEFHLAAGVAAIAAVLGNRLYCETWGQRIYPNLWTVIVARSGFMNKSTSINLAERLVRDAGLGNVFYPSEASREAALEVFRDQPAGLMVLDEFGSFLAVNARDYQSGYLEQLTELYGKEEFKRKTKTGGEVVIKRPAINIFSATTVDWLEDRVSPAMLRGGFLYRVLFMAATEKATERDFTRMDPLARNRLVFGLRHIGEIGVPKGPLSPTADPIEITFTPEAHDAVRAWFRQWEAEAMGTTARQDMLGFAVRLRTSLLKLAMIFRASVCAFDPSADPLVIDTDAVTAAIGYVRLAWQNVLHIFDEEFAPDRDAQIRRSILEKIGHGCSRSELLRRTHLKARDLDAWLDTMLEADEIQKEQTYAAQMGLTRQRNRELFWFAPGHNHPAEIARRRAEPKPEWKKEEERKWDEAIEQERQHARERELARVSHDGAPPDPTDARDAALAGLFDDPAPDPTDARELPAAPKAA